MGRSVNYHTRTHAAVGIDPCGVFITVPDAPGLGIEDYNDEVIREHLHPDYPELWAETSRWDNIYSHDRTWS